MLCSECRPHGPKVHACLHQAVLSDLASVLQPPVAPRKQSCTHHGPRSLQLPPTHTRARTGTTPPCLPPAALQGWSGATGSSACSPAAGGRAGTSQGEGVQRASHAARATTPNTGAPPAARACAAQHMPRLGRRTPASTPCHPRHLSLPPPSLKRPAPRTLPMLNTGDCRSHPLYTYCLPCRDSALGRIFSPGMPFHPVTSHSDSHSPICGTDGVRGGCRAGRGGCCGRL